MLRRRTLLGLALVCLVACNDSGPFVFQAFIVDADGGNPVTGTDATTLQIEIREGERDERDLEFPVTDGSFDGTLEFESFNELTQIRVAIDGPTTSLSTAPPAFVPSLSSGFLRVVTTSPGSCVRIGFDEMRAPRASFGMVQSGTFALLVGGTSAEEEQVEFLDALEWESRLFLDDFALSTLGPTRAAAIDETKILVVPQDATAFIFDMADATDRITTAVLHPGAGSRSALVSVPGVGAMVLGGEVGGEAQRAVSVVSPEGDITFRQLSQPRSGAAAVALGEDVLVIGGDEVGDAELLREGSETGEPVADLSDGVRVTGLLIGDGLSRALLIGGTDAQGMIRQDTVRIDDCPDACVSGPGPQWVTARLQALQPEATSLIIGGVDSPEIEEVQWSGEDIQIAPLFDLTVPRAAPGGIVFESGAFVVGGGNDGVNPRADFEFCAPDPLTPIQ